MQTIDLLTSHYGWEGLALIALLLIMFCVQIYYYFFVYGRIPSYRNNLRPTLLESEPPVSVVIPVFSEDYEFVEERLPLMLAQCYTSFEVVLVYVGTDNDFFEDLQRLKHSFPQIVVTKIHLNPRFPISRKMALNVGIKSAHNEHLLFSSTEVVPRSDRWLSLMAKGFCKGEIVVGYCGLERGKGFSNYIMRTWRMMHAADYLARAVQGHPYRAAFQNFGFTKNVYFNANGFSHLNMNIGEDDLFMQRVMTPDNVSMILSPRASLTEKTWGGFDWWFSRERYFGSAASYYPESVKSFIRMELGSRVLFFLLALAMLVLLPGELKIAAGTALLLRWSVVVWQVRRLAKRLGETGIAARYVVYDLLSPVLAAMLSFSLLRKDERVWR